MTTTQTGTCPHVTPAMVEAGFTCCALCGTDGPPPPAGFTIDSTARQEAALAAAWRDLADTLTTLASEASDAAVFTKRKRKPTVESLLAPVRSAIRSLDVCEQAVDTASYDLATAKGADG